MLVISATIFTLLALIAGATQNIKPDTMYWTKEIETAYERFQMEHYGNIMPTVGVLELENGEIDADRSSDWTESKAQQQLFEND